MKLQPNFSWQKYEGKDINDKDQFQYQLQREHIVVANAVNTTIDDISFWITERATGETWVTGKQIFTKTIPTNAWTAGGTVNTIQLGITGDFTIFNMFCCLSDGTLSTSNTINLPHIDVGAAANEVSIVRNGTQIVLISGGTDFSAWSGYVTIYYTKS